MIGRPSDMERPLERLGLAHRADVRVKQLSGGEKRRLDLVLATMGEPELLFLDEPTTGLDPESRMATWEVIRDLLAGGTTVLLTTHYLEEAERLAHRLAIMHEGRIAVSGGLVDVLDSERARIDFELAEGAALPEVRGDIDRDRLAEGLVRIRTRELQRDLTTVVGWAEASGVRLRRFRAHHASLDDVFHGVVNSIGSDTQEGAFR